MADQLFDPLEVELAPVHARRGEGHLGGQLVAVLCDQRDRLVRAVHAAAPDPVQQHQLCAEALSLAAGLAGELRAADSLGKAEEVLDAVRVGGLPARNVAVEDNRRQPVGGGVDRGGQPRRAAADHDEIVFVALRRIAVPKRVRNPLESDVCVRLVLVDDDEQVVLLEAACAQELIGLARPSFVPLIRLGHTREEVAHAIVLGVHPPADQLQRRPNSHGMTVVRAVGSGAPGGCSDSQASISGSYSDFSPSQVAWEGEEHRRASGRTA